MYTVVTISWFIFPSVFIVSTEETAQTCIRTHSAVTHSGTRTEMQIWSYTPVNINCSKMQIDSMWPVSSEICSHEKNFSPFFVLDCLVLNPARSLIFGLITITSSMQHYALPLLSKHPASLLDSTVFCCNVNSANHRAIGKCVCVKVKVYWIHLNVNRDQFCFFKIYLHKWQSYVNEEIIEENFSSSSGDLFPSIFVCDIMINIIVCNV